MEISALPEKNEAKIEIHETLRSVNFFFGIIGIPIINLPETSRGRFKMYLNFILSVTFNFGIATGQYVCIANNIAKAKSVVDFVGSNLHIAGYGLMSFCKLIAVWHKRDTFIKLVVELAEIWPVSLRDDEASTIKRECLTGLKIKQYCYIFFNLAGVWFFCLTPICLFIYHNKIKGEPVDLGYVYQLAYPFDKTQPIYHEIAFAFEAFSSNVSVFIMTGVDLLFITMASHISMLLRLLQVKIRKLITDDSNLLAAQPLVDCYSEIVDVVKVHQKIISYVSDLEVAFSVVNLINVLLSSINICCVMFNIVFLEPWLELSNKFYLGAALTQMGFVCWYADDVFRASVAVSDAVYESRWYETNVRCRRALFVILQRAQKPLYFTTMKFSSITMATYSSILTTAYSYFTLIYSSYRN